MEALKCPNCGGNIVKADDDIFFCPYCGIGIPADVKKTKLQIEIKSDERKTITHTKDEKKVIVHRDRAKEYEHLSELIFMIFFVVSAVAFIIWCVIEGPPK